MREERGFWVGIWNYQNWFSRLINLCYTDLGSVGYLNSAKVCMFREREWERCRVRQYNGDWQNNGGKSIWLGGAQGLSLLLA